MIQHIKCPIQDHRGNGKVERLIRTLNERIRMNQKTIPDKDLSAISGILWALQASPGPNKSYPSELQNSRKIITLKDIQEMFGYFVWWG